MAFLASRNGPSEPERGLCGIVFVYDVMRMQLCHCLDLDGSFVHDVAYDPRDDQVHYVY